MTAEELRRMPEDGFRYELVRGELRKMTPAGHRHGRMVINITTPLR
jgi:Uma2 family endonuclease